MSVLVIMLATLLTDSSLNAVRAFLAAFLAFAMLALWLMALAKKNGVRVRKALSERLTALGALAALATVVLTLPQIQTLLVGSSVETERAPRLAASSDASPEIVAARRVDSDAAPDVEADFVDDEAEILLASYARKAAPDPEPAPELDETLRIAEETASTSLVNETAKSDFEESRNLDAEPAPLSAPPTVPQSDEPTQMASLVDAREDARWKISGEAKERVCMVKATARDKPRAPVATKIGTLAPYPGSRGTVYVTAFHSVADSKASEIRAVLANGEERRPIFVYPDKTRDLAVLFFQDELLDYCPTLRDVVEEPIRPGELCYGVGCRLNMLGTFFSSEVGAVRDRDELKDLFYQEASLNPDLRLYQLNARVAEGDSGGSAYDSSDRYFGMIKAKSKDGEYVFVIPADDVAKVVADAEKVFYGETPKVF